MEDRKQKKDIKQENPETGKKETDTPEPEEKREKQKEKQNKHRKTKTEEISELKEQVNELNDKYLRLFSDFDNYRKRTNIEKLELIKTASKKVIEGLLPVLDDFDRALQHVQDQEFDEESVKGFELIYNKLLQFLKQQGLEPMDSQGKEFNTDYHDAITQIPAPNKNMKGKVVDVIQKGYLLNGIIIRHAKVVVGE